MKNVAWRLVAPIELGEVGKPVQILRTGKWNFRDVGPLEVTPVDIIEFADNFAKGVRRQEIPINAEHQKHFGALGFLKSVYTTNNDTELWGEPDYNAAGTQQVQEGRWKYNSAELMRFMEDPETGVIYKNVLIGLAHTNYPRIKDMAAIAASEPLVEPLADAAVDDLWTAFREAAFAENPHLPDSWRHLGAAAPVRDIPPAAPPQPTPPQRSATVPTDAEIKLAEMGTQISEMRSQIALAETRNTSLQTELAETRRLLDLETNTRTLLEFSEAVETARRELRITPADADHYLAEGAKLAKDLRDFIVADIKRRQPLLSLAEVGNGNPGSTANGENRVIRKTGENGTVAEFGNLELAELTETIKAEQKVDYKTALRLANAQLKKGSH